MCGSLSVIGPHNLIGSGTIRRCGFVGVGMALLEEVCDCEGGLWCFLCSEQPSELVDFLLSTKCRILNSFSSTISACMLPCSQS